FLVTKPDNFYKPPPEKPYSAKQRKSSIAKLEREYGNHESDTTILRKKINLFKYTRRSVSDSDMESLDVHYKTFAQYDSAQKTLSPQRRHGWLKRLAVRKFEFNSASKGNVTKPGLEWTNIFLHKLPYL